MITTPPDERQFSADESDAEQRNRRRLIRWSLTVLIVCVLLAAVVTNLVADLAH